jgi:hypothetical protein
MSSRSPLEGLDQSIVKSPHDELARDRCDVAHRFDGDHW